LHQSLASANRSDILTRLSIRSGSFGLVTLHRPSNVDDLSQLNEILEALAEISRSLPLFFPVHPRTRVHLAEHAKLPGNIVLLDPLGYVDFLCLMANSAIVLTDSGGIQEETTALGVPCLTLRNNTERPITVDEGTNILAGTRASTILAAWHQMQKNPKMARVPALWDGATASRCVDVLQRYFCSDLVALESYGHSHERAVANGAGSAI
jgi:UDP-N-acetylglucosamine 2-epimerase (non-hydrolysing)